MNDETRNGRLDASARDPIEWAIIGVIIAGSSLILALEAKIEARRRAESDAAARKAQAANRLRLRTIRAHLNEIRGFVSLIQKLGKIEVNSEKPGISRHSITFTSETDEESFNQYFDRVTALIGRINRCLSEFDPQGIPLSDENVRIFVTEPMRRAQNKVIPLLQPDLDPYNRIGMTDDLLQDYANLIENLENVLK